MQKCQLRKNKLKFLGYTLSAAGLELKDELVEAITKAPTPTNNSELRSFLGLVSYCSKFIPNYVTHVEPLRALTRKNATFEWTSAQKNFEKLKKILNGSTIALFDPALLTVVSTDASDCGLGAVLTQVDTNGFEHTVAFASRILSEVERKYSVVEKEVLACVWAVEKWRNWL